MSQQFPTTTLTLHGPQDLLIEIPALIGFHPEESVVLLLTADKAVQCVVRVDLEGDLGGRLAGAELGVPRRVHGIRRRDDPVDGAIGGGEGGDGDVYRWQGREKRRSLWAVVWAGGDVGGLIQACTFLKI